MDVARLRSTLALRWHIPQYDAVLTEAKVNLAGRGLDSQGLLRGL
jgi:hypothetical protein